ncbi:aldolase [Halobacteriales archaeon SW_7_65_23]|nr:MAG: aldolase [Halobacteriales archaeon SW_7_65_23]
MRPIDDTPLSRDGKVLILAYDHGLEHGPVDFEEVPESADPERVFKVAKHPAVTSLAVQKGIAEAYYPSYEDEVTLLAKLNGTSNLWMGEPDSSVNWSVDYAAEVGYPRGQGLKNDKKPSVIAYAARKALELGADVAKVKYPGSREAMEHVVEMAGKTKVIMSGGSKRSDREFLENVEAVIDAGGAGLAVGRNVFQRENPTRILDALEQVIYEEASVDTALAAAER